MILADKIIKLRKQYGWSQEELADKMNVSRQSVSKWESATSIPDLNKIILLGEIFGVSTDYLVKDEIENVQVSGLDQEPGEVRISLEEASEYVEKKIEMSKLIAIGVVFCICSVVPLFFLLAMEAGDVIAISSNMATAIGLVALLVSVAIGVSFFMRSSQYDSDFARIEEVEFELDYGVRSIFKEKFQKYRGTYLQRMSIGIFMIIISVVPLLITAIFSDSTMAILLMLIVLIVFIGAGVFLMIPSGAENSAYSCIIGEGDYSPEKRNKTKRIERFGGFYWPLITAVYIGWSLWTMDWHITWIIWPVAGVAFAAVIGLISFIESEKEAK